jgi:hypothetical protein
LVVIALVSAFVIATLALFVWPPLPSLPPHADAIIELAGPGLRDSAALDLARQGVAPVLVQSTVEAEAGGHTCLPPVPGVTIMCFHPDPATTQGEARYIGEMGARLGWKSVIIVTTPDHALRARLRVQRCFPGQVYVSTAHLPAWDWFVQIPYQWTASIKALVFQTQC